MPAYRHDDAPTQGKLVGKPMGMVGSNTTSAAPKTAADLERTTGFEPATLTLAR